MKGRIFAALSIAAVVVMSTAAGAAVVGDGDQGGRLSTAMLDGASERPGPGDPDGTGTAAITLNQGQGQVCFELTWDDIDTPTAAHIHEAPVTAPGPVVVPLTVDPAEGCTTADADLIKAIRQNPDSFYVNIHNADFAGGAIRGQLTR